MVEKMKKSLVVAMLVIMGIVGAFYKIGYRVTINGEEVGYTKNKSESFK